MPSGICLPSITAKLEISDLFIDSFLMLLVKHLLLTLPPLALQVIWDNQPQ